MQQSPDYLRPLFEKAERLQNVGALLDSLHRVQGLTGFPEHNWPALWEDRISEAPAAYRGLETSILHSPLLSIPDALQLLTDCGEFFREAATDAAFQNSPGWLARQALKYEKHEKKEGFSDWREKLRPHLLDAARKVRHGNYALTQGLQLFPQELKAEALAWMRKRPHEFQTHYLLVAYLNAHLPCDEVARCLEEWLKKHGNLPKAQFVYNAWLKAEGDQGLVEKRMLAWLEKHGDLPEAQFVYNAWLTAGGDRSRVEKPMLAWLVKHGHLSEARFVYRAYLEAKGEPGLVEKRMLAWLEKHGDLPEKV